jgi:hypothetical protein
VLHPTRRAGPVPDLAHLRASQTAEIVAARWAPRWSSSRGSEPLDVDVVADILRTPTRLAPAAVPRRARPGLLGVWPNLGVTEITMRKGAIARIDLEGQPIEAGGGVLRYLVPPELLPSR